MTNPRVALGRGMAAVALGAASLMAGCDKPQAMGQVSEILVATPVAVWRTLEEDLKAALEPSIFTVRNERVFDVAHADPTDVGWENLRLMRQMLLIGDANDPL